MKKYKVGYTTGVFDLFHIGHLNILKRAKQNCEFLIVGITVDELVSYKKTKAFIPFKERFEIVKSIKYVDKVVPQDNMNKLNAWEKYNFDVMFVGDDWKGSRKWNELENSFLDLGVDIVYFPYTDATSSTKLKAIINDNLNDKVKAY